MNRAEAINDIQVAMSVALDSKLRLMDDVPGPVGMTLLGRNVEYRSLVFNFGRQMGHTTWIRDVLNSNIIDHMRPMVVFPNNALSNNFLRMLRQFTPITAAFSHTVFDTYKRSKPAQATDVVFFDNWSIYKKEDIDYVYDTFHGELIVGVG